MKKCRQLLLALLVLTCFITQLTPLTGFAKERDYSIRFYGGNIGTVSGTYSIDLNGNIVPPTVTIPSEKSEYGLKGFIESGKDPRNFYQGAIVYPNQDVDYVAVYKIDSTEVPYRVQYLLNGTTRKLAEDGVFYAGIGDKPIASYIYIEGYQPYLRSTKTLEGDESKDILVCYYTAIPTGGGGGGAAAAGGGAAVAGGGAAVAAGAAGAAGAANPAGAGNAANPAGAGNAANPAGAGNAANPAGGTTAPAAPQYQQTEDILDLDVPLAAPEFNTASGKPAVSAPKQIEPTQRSPLPSWALIAGAVVLVGLISMLYWYLLFYRKRKRFEEYDFSVFDEK